VSGFETDRVPVLETRSETRPETDARIKGIPPVYRQQGELSVINRLLDHGEEFAEAMRDRLEEGGGEQPEPTTPSEGAETDGGKKDGGVGDTQKEGGKKDTTGLEGLDGGEGDEGSTRTDETERRLDGMENRVEDVENTVDDVKTSVRKMEEKQDEVSESIDEIDERMRKLVGIYDEVISESNPFSEGNLEDGDENKDGFGVVPGETDQLEEPDEDAEEAHEHEEAVTSYDDLTEEVPGDEGVVEEVIEDPHEGTEEFDEVPRNGGQNGDEPAPANGFDDGNGSAHEAGSTEDVGEHPLPSGDDDKPFLDGFEPSYAADIIMMEWMSVMTVRSDPAGAMKALDYYESIGWISSDVRNYLETVVGGPGVDSHVNPGDVESPGIRDHEMSHGYIKQLKEITEM
jgi:archaellum component FlaD/FlaE